MKLPSHLLLLRPSGCNCLAVEGRAGHPQQRCQDLLPHCMHPFNTYQHVQWFLLALSCVHFSSSFTDLAFIS